MAGAIPVRAWVDRLLVAVGLILTVMSVPATGAEADSNRARFNQGTAHLASGDLNEAVTLLRSVVASNDPFLQPMALYNLGHARFRAGREELQRGPDEGSAARRGQAAGESVGPVLQQGWDALSSGSMDSMLAAYRRGRGVRKELKAALSAIRSALEQHEATLALWRRASGDFHGVLELKGGDADAAFNAEVVDGHIARLIDRMHQLSQVARDSGNRRSDLDRMLQEMKRRMPEQMRQEYGDGEEDDEDSDGPQPGQREPSRPASRETHMSPEEVRRLLEGFRLDRSRTLPMGGERRSPAPNPAGRGW